MNKIFRNCTQIINASLQIIWGLHFRRFCLSNCLNTMADKWNTKKNEQSKFCLQLHCECPWQCIGNGFACAQQATSNCKRHWSHWASAFEGALGYVCLLLAFSYICVSQPEGVISVNATKDWNVDQEIQYMWSVTHCQTISVHHFTLITCICNIRIRKSYINGVCFKLCNKQLCIFKKNNQIKCLPFGQNMWPEAFFRRRPWAFPVKIHVQDFVRKWDKNQMRHAATSKHDFKPKCHLVTNEAAFTCHQYVQQNKIK